MIAWQDMNEYEEEDEADFRRHEKHGSCLVLHGAPVQIKDFLLLYLVWLSGLFITYFGCSEGHGKISCIYGPNLAGR